MDSPDNGSKISRRGFLAGAIGTALGIFGIKTAAENLPSPGQILGDTLERNNLRGKMDKPELSVRERAVKGWEESGLIPGTKPPPVPTLTKPRYPK